MALGAAPLALVEAARRSSRSHPNWTYGGTLQGLFGRLLYDGKPVHGFKTADGVAEATSNARYVYIDTLNSAYGPGWKRDGAKRDAHRQRRLLLQLRTALVPPAGYPSVPSVSGQGERHRVTVMGPA